MLSSLARLLVAASFFAYHFHSVHRAYCIVAGEVYWETAKMGVYITSNSELRNKNTNSKRRRNDENANVHAKGIHS